MRWEAKMKIKELLPMNLLFLTVANDDMVDIALSAVQNHKNFERSRTKPVLLKTEKEKNFRAPKKTFLSFLNYKTYVLELYISS